MKEQPTFICKICKNQVGNIPWTTREMMYGLRDEFQYFECSKCHCLQIETFPVDMSKYYPTDYYSFQDFDGRKFKGFKGTLKKWQYRSSVIPSSIVQRILKRIWPVKHYGIFSDLKITPQTSILDVGCGNGRSFLYPLAEIGFKSLAGCDPFINHSISYKNGLEIYKTGIEEMKGEWDIITWHHSFEHLSDPLKNLQKAFELLSDEGICIIRIPTTSSYAWEHYRTNWAQLDAPRHYFLHSKESISILADQAGLKLYKVVYDSTHFQFSGSEKYVMDIHLSTSRPRGLLHFFKRKWKKRKYMFAAKRLNKEGKGDQAAFFLKRK